MFATVKTLNDRIRLSLLHAETRMKEKELAEKLGKSQRWFSGVKNGQWNADKELREAAKILGVPEDWLIHGTGPAPTWSPKPPPEHESIQKSIDLLVKMFTEQQAEIKALRQEIQDLKPKRPSEPPITKRRDRPVLDLPEPIHANVE